MYRENIRLSEALSLHIKHEETLEKSQAKLEITNRQLVAEKELNQELVKEKIKQSAKHKKLIKQLQVRSERGGGVCVWGWMYLYEGDRDVGERWR